MTHRTVGARSLAKVPLQLIEAALADALSEIAGQRFSASIRQLDLHPTPAATLSDEYEIVVRIRRDDHGFFDEPQASSESTSSTQTDKSEEDDDQSEDMLGEVALTGLTGRQLNHEWEVGARHALYHHHGRWYHQLRRFPGALFDYNGYVVFRTEEEFRKSSHINITKDVHVPRGIASMPGYIRRR